MKKLTRLAFYPGDGIGREVGESAAAVLEALKGDGSGPDFEIQWFDWGCDYYARHGRVVPENFLEQLRPFDALFLGAVGWPEKLPDAVTLEPLIQMRQSFDLYACVRPARTFRGVPTPLRDERALDLVVVRENSEGEYVDAGGRFHPGSDEDMAVQTAVHTRRGVTRILKFAFELATKRRKKLTLITKSNAQRHAYVLWEEAQAELAPSYPEIATNRMHIDAATLHMVRDPGQFDVIVGSNLFGDILSDLSGAITGSLGLNPSSNLNPERKFPSLFEPVHGSAPDIAGQGMANPVGAILSIEEMLRFLGHPEPAGRIGRAVERCFEAGCGTPDVGGTLSTRGFTAEVVARLDG